MRKTSIYLDDDVDAALTYRALREHRSKADVIRAALRAAADEGARPRPRAIGVFEGPGDLASRVDEYLAETGFGEP